MIQRLDLLQSFLNAVDLLSDDEKHDGVFFGSVSITDRTGLEAILVRYTGYIDQLLLTLPLSPAQQFELIISRCCTYDEYCMLWDSTIKPKDFQDYKIFNVLLITTEKERFLFTSVRDDSHEEFVLFLQEYTKCNNPFLYNFLYETYT